MLNRARFTTTSVQNPFVCYVRNSPSTFLLHGLLLTKDLILPYFTLCLSSNTRARIHRSLQDGLGTINTERVRFQRACEDIELHHQDELQELKQHLAMALTSFQELQRASEHRESEMREALKGATNRSQKFEDEKDALLASMNDQRMNGAAAAKEAEMLKEAIAKLQGEHEKKIAEYEDARKRFSQVKEALTVERNLRARAEIKEEQMRQEIIATTGQMHAMRDKFTTDIQDEKEVVDNRTEELDQKVGVVWLRFAFILSMAEVVLTWL